MSMSLLRYTQDGQILWGIIENQRIVPLQLEALSTAQLLRHDLDSLRRLRLPEQTRDLPAPSQQLSPISAPCKILCKGANYRQHAQESGLTQDQPFNLFFTKSSAAIHTPSGYIQAPPFVRLLDYEIELALVLKKDTSGTQDIRPENLHEYVGGICIANDVSARDIQIRQGQFHKAKSYRTFCPLGPVLCLLEPQEMAYLSRLQLTLSVNGQIRQEAHTSGLIHDPVATLSEFSQICDFSAGDVLLTGTPAGCALRVPSETIQRCVSWLSAARRWQLFMALQSHRPYLRAGDQISSCIVSDDGEIHLGTQQHEVVFLPEAQ